MFLAKNKIKNIFWKKGGAPTELLPQKASIDFSLKNKSQKNHI